MVPKYRVRLYPPFGYRIFYKEYNLTGFNRQKNASHILDPKHLRWFRG